VFGSVLKALGSDGRVYAIDPHDGVVGALDRGLCAGPTTLARFERNIADAGLKDVIVTVQRRSFEVTWEQPISLLFIDGLHDYANVARDFYHFEPSVGPGGYIAFHDYADYYPGVKAFVNELIGGADYERVLCVRSMMLLRKRGGERSGEDRAQRDLAGVAADDDGDGDHTGAPRVEVRAVPLVSCIMPTADRRSLAAQAVACFLRQDYARRELIIVDDGDDPAAPAVRRDPRIRCVRLERKATVEAKRNLACELAHGEVIVHWNDDDWHGPGRLTAQIEDLRRSGADVVGLDRVLLYDPLAARAWIRRAVKGDPPMLACGTLCYRKDVWRDREAPSAAIGGDEPFVWNRAGYASAPAGGMPFYIGLIHSSTARPFGSSGPEWQPHPVDVVRAALARDCAYYDTVFQRDARPAYARGDAAATAVRPQDQPLVSCLMPTFNRGLFVPQALRCFLAQDYPHKELIVIDDGEDRVGQEVSADGSIHYVSLDRRLSLGEKRNLAAALSNGEILAHWDDDDWYGPQYLTRVVDRLCQAGRESLTGLSRYLVYLLSTASLKICASKGPAGATFCYWKPIWQRHPYRDTHRAEDFFFLEDARPHVRCLQEPELFAIVRHRDHTWTSEHGRDVTRRLSALPAYKRSMEEIVGAEAAKFYERARETIFAAETSNAASAKKGF
jgi:glycosyltransferase involved in cell wall biosynthesis